MIPYLSAVVEGDVDAAVVRRLVLEAGIGVGSMHVKRGKQNVRSRIVSYNAASRQMPFFVLVDLDADYECAPALIADWLPDREVNLCFRIAVRAVEAWLLGDRARIASFFRVKQRDIPAYPEQLAAPKRMLVEIAREGWRPEVAAEVCDSLRRARQSLFRFTR